MNRILRSGLLSLTKFHFLVYVADERYFDHGELLVFVPRYADLDIFVLAAKAEIINSNGEIGTSLFGGKLTITASNGNICLNSVMADFDAARLIAFNGEININDR